MNTETKGEIGAEKKETTLLICDDVTKTDGMKFEEFTKLASMIIQRMDYISPRNNVYHAIKNQMLTIRASYNEFREELGNGRPTLGKDTTIEKANQAIETRFQKVPSQSRQETQKRIREAFDNPLIDRNCAEDAAGKIIRRFESPHCFL